MAARDCSARHGAIGGRAPNFHHDQHCDPDPLEWLDNELLDDDGRKALDQIAHPIIGLDGRLCWPVEEIRGVGHD